ncbi:phage tail tape measure protein [Vreelandella sp. EE22]
MQRNLRLQVMLNAIDRVTGPLKKMREGAGKTAQAMRENQTQLKELQRQQSDLTSYRQANVAMRQNTRAMRDARERNRQYTQALDQQREAHVAIKSRLTVNRREYDRLAKQLLNTKQPNDQLTQSLDRARVRLQNQQTEFDRSARAMREYRNRTRAADDEVKKLTRNHATQTERIRGLKTRLDEAGISTDNLGRSSRELRTKEERLNTALQEQKRHLSEVAQRQRRLTEARDRYQNGQAHVARAQGVGMGMFGTGIAQGYMASRLLAPGIAWGETMSELRAVGGFAQDDAGYLALRQQSRDYGASTAFSANEVGAGQVFLKRAGMSEGAIEASMKDVLELALANKTDLARTADIASNIASGFKVDMEADGAMARLADTLSGTARRTNVNLEMLGETFKYLGGLEGLGISYDQAAGIVGLMGNIGIQGTQAGTAGRAMGERLAAPTERAAGLMDEYGIEIADAQGNMRDLEEILGNVYQATKDLGNVQRASILKEIFGTTAGTGISEVISQQGAGGLTDLLEELKNNEGENAEMARVMADNIGGDLKNWRSAWEEVGNAITDTNEGPLRELIQNITAITRGVSDWIKTNPELAGTIAKVAGSMIALATVGGAVTMTFASILSPLLFTRYLMTALGIKAGGLGKAFGWLAKTAIPWVAGALKGLLVAMGPIGWGVMAIAAMALVIYKYWEPIKAFFSGLWQQVKDAFDDGIGGVSLLLVNWSPFGLLWAGMSSALGRLGIELPETLTELGTGMIEALSNGITAARAHARSAVDGIWTSITSAFDNGIGGVTTLLINWSPFGLLYNALTSTLTRLGATIPESFSDFGSMIVDGIIGGITGKLGDLRNSITGAASSAVGWFKERLDINSPSRVFAQLGGFTMQGLANGIEDDADSPLKQVRSVATNLRNAAGGLVLGAGISTGAAANVDTSAIQIDARPPLQSQANQPNGGLTIYGGINIEVNAAPGMDEQALARLVNQQVERALRDAERRAAAVTRRNFYDND